MGKATIVRRKRPADASRRRALALGLGGTLWVLITPARATPESMAAAIRAAFGDARIKPGRVRLDLPKVAENGNVVPLTISVESPMRADDYVKAIHVFSEKNPRPVVVEFQLSPRSAKAQVGTRIRLAGSQQVVAVARMSDGTLWSAATQVEVTTSACGD